MNYSFSSKVIGLLVLVGIISFLTASFALANGGARVYPQLSEKGDKVLVVDIVAEGVTEMYGAEFQVRYDPAIVSVQDTDTEHEGIQIEPGLLLPVSQGFVVANKVDEVEGLITFAATLLNPAPPVSGNGSLARVVFNVRQDTPSTISVAHSKLVAFSLEEIPSETAAVTIGGENAGELVAATNLPAQGVSPRPEEAPATAPEEVQVVTATEEGFPWWALGVAAALFMVVLAGVVVVGGVSKPQPAQRR